ncbi:class I SAM-dependent methyltransferase [Patescibacteria group bacterium AH-259-L05]|nr:class I SAM-dependent methyltransferase [Patescibacteria group bacterium AH-259-L05]
MVDYSTITELPRSKASKEQFARSCNRYYFAAQFCENKDVLEVACGAGQGLGFLAKKAKTVIGGDIDKNILKYAKEYYQGRDNIELRSFDAHNLPFEDNSFDVIIIYEAIYYLKHPEKFLKEAWRVLRKTGTLIIGTVNKDWSDFNKSPFSYKYYSVPELYNLLKNHNFKDIKFFADCPISTKSLKNKIISIIKRVAVKLHLIPKTMKGKEVFKRLLFGKLLELPPEIKHGMVKYSPPMPIPHNVPGHQYKVFFAVAHKQ